jgi:riboflavin kinase/FMN adenylyltransferase
MPEPRVVPGLAALDGEIGPLYAVVGVFDGLHRGHAYLIEHLVRGARRRSARPTVITFDHHPDEIIRGAAPPLLLDPAERIARLAAAGVEVVLVVHFDQRLRRTGYREFIDAIRQRSELAGLLMTRESAFGHERRGTPAALTALGRDRGFDVDVIEPLALEGGPVSSSSIRAAIAAGDLRTAHRLLGRSVAVTGEATDRARRRLGFLLPVALPPDGAYRTVIGPPVDDGGRLAAPARRRIVTIAGGEVTLASPAPGDGRVRVAFRS